MKKIDCGLPLFLFNYTDRKLHGIFEASSTGKMYIDPYAWINDDYSDETQFPAQVTYVNCCLATKQTIFYMMVKMIHVRLIKINTLLLLNF